MPPLNNIYPNNPYNSMAQQNQVPQMQQSNQNNTNIVFIQGGLQGANVYPVPAGCTISLWDTEQNTIYVKSVDAAGIPQPIRILDYTEREAPNVQNEENANYVTEEKLNKILDEKFASFAQSMKPKYNKKYGNQTGGKKYAK